MHTIQSTQAHLTTNATAFHSRSSGNCHTVRTTSVFCVQTRLMRNGVVLETAEQPGSGCRCYAIRTTTVDCRITRTGNSNICQSTLELSVFILYRRPLTIRHVKITNIRATGRRTETLVLSWWYNSNQCWQFLQTLPTTSFFDHILSEVKVCNKKRRYAMVIARRTEREPMRG